MQLTKAPSRRRPAFLVALANAVLIAFCGGHRAAAQDQKAAIRQIEPGISFQTADGKTSVGTITHLWIYLPSGATGKVPCVVIAPAGSPLVWGMDLAEGDRAEHLPYARAGFAVVAYSIDGGVRAGSTAAQYAEATQAFRKARAGLVDSAAALDYVRAFLPQIDPRRVFTVGHSSAATLALLTAEIDPRIKACVAFAPVADVARRYAAALPALEKALPGMGDFFVQSSPITHAANLRCPLFLFRAADDTNVPAADTAAFRKAVSATNDRVTYFQAATGGHYQSMIAAGIPRAIAWLKALK